MWKNNLEFKDPKNQKNWFLQLVYSFSKHLLSSYYVPMLGQELWWSNEVPLHASQDGCYPKVYKQ